MTSPWTMRYAPHLGFPTLDQPYFRHTVGTDDPVAQIAHIANLGFAGVEDDYLMLRDAEDQIRIGKALRFHNLEMGCFVANPKTSREPLWGRPNVRELLKAKLSEALSVAERVNGRYLLTVTGRDADVPLAAQLDAMTENLKWAADLAETAGVVLCLEQTNEIVVPGMLLHHIADVEAMVRAVNSPAVRLLFDTCHVQIMDGDVIPHLERCLDILAVVQVGGAYPARCEIDMGEQDFAAIFRVLKKGGYRGLIELEHKMSAPGVVGEARALAALRTIDAAI